jgi:Ca-activated chloride channel homolog
MRYSFLQRGTQLPVHKVLLPSNQRCLALLVALFLLLYLLGLANPAHCQSVEELVAEGNRLFKEERFEDALAVYEKAKEMLPENERLDFNRGAARYARGDYQQALKGFNEATTSPEREVAAKAHYNRGNAHVKRAEEMRKQKGFADAVKELGSASLAYRQALRLEPLYEDAGVNLELSRMMLKELKEEEEKIKQEESSEKDKEKKESAADAEKGCEQQSEQEQAEDGAGAKEQGSAGEEGKEQNETDLTEKPAAQDKVQQRPQFYRAPENEVLDEPKEEEFGEPEYNDEGDKDDLWEENLIDDAQRIIAEEAEQRERRALRQQRGEQQVERDW